MTPEGREHSPLVAAYQASRPLIGNWCLNKLAAIKSSPMKLYFFRDANQSKSFIPAWQGVFFKAEVTAGNGTGRHANLSDFNLHSAENNPITFFSIEYQWTLTTAIIPIAFIYSILVEPIRNLHLKTLIGSLNLIVAQFSSPTLVRACAEKHSHLVLTTYMNHQDSITSVSGDGNLQGPGDTILYQYLGHEMLILKICVTLDQRYSI